MKAIIELASRGSIFNTAREQLAGAKHSRRADYRLGFESTKTLFAEFTPARIDLLDTLRKNGPCSVYALA